MWYCGFGITVCGAAKALPYIYASLHGHYGPCLRTVLKPSPLYCLPEPMQAMHGWLEQHRHWCRLHRGVESLAAWQPMDLAPWQFFGTLFGHGRWGYVQPLELPQLKGQLCFRMKWNARLTGPVAANDVRFHWREAELRKLTEPRTGWHYYRYYPAECWLPMIGAPTAFHCTHTPGGRWAVCEGIW